MPDKRPVDDLSVEELERILAIKRREYRQQHLQRMKRNGRVVAVNDDAPPPHPVSDADGLSAQTVEMPASALRERKRVPQFEEAIDTRTFQTERRERARRIWWRFVDRSLVALEIVAIVGLVVLAVALFNGLNILQDETADAQRAAEEFRSAAIPTIAPTPQLRLTNVVLPSGHLIQNGVPQFNFGEIPENLRWQVANQVFLPPDRARPAVTDDTPLRVLIPEINVDNSIVQGVDWNALQQGVGMLANGAVPSSDGDNVVLAAHNDIYGEIFRDLDQLETGDLLQVQTRSGIYTYRVHDWQIVEPDAVHVMNPQGSAMVTLISCYPYQVNTHRIVVFADRVDA
jgi:sortase A